MKTGVAVFFVIASMILASLLGSAQVKSAKTITVRDVNGACWEIKPDHWFYSGTRVGYTVDFASVECHGTALGSGTQDPSATASGDNAQERSAQMIVEVGTRVHAGWSPD